MAGLAGHETWGWVGGDCTGTQMGIRSRKRLHKINQGYLTAKSPQKTVPLKKPLIR